MPNIKDKKDQIRPCSGCGICSVTCSHECITMELNADGFVRPKVSSDCIDCSLCKKTCFKYADFESRCANFWSGKRIYSFKSTNPMALATSSSGAFVNEVYAEMLNCGYKACGAIYDYNSARVIHFITNSKENLPILVGSKYLPSFTHDAFNAIKRDKDSKYVVVGTPCQIYGLHQWATRFHCRDRFFLIDFFCAGVPSYNLWNCYLEYLEKEYSLGEIQEVSFRDKKSGWHSYGMRIIGSNNTYYKPNATSEDYFFRLFLSDVCKQKSCSKGNCLFRKDHCFSDIRVGDFWGECFSEDQTGVSVVIPNSEKGTKLLFDFEIIEQSGSFNVADLRMLSDKRGLVLEALRNGTPIFDVWNLVSNQSLLSKIKNKINTLINGTR